MARTMYSFKNEVRWENHMPSWRKLKKDARNFGKELENILDPLKNIPRSPSSPNSPNSPNESRRIKGDHDAQVKFFRKRNEEEAKFAELQDKVIRRFSIANKDIRAMSESTRQSFINRLKEQKTVKDLLFMERKLKAEVQDEVRAQKIRTREKEKQLLVQRRLTASTEQMVGALASVYTAAAAGQAVTRVGMDFEAFEKTFLAVSKDTEDAKEQMEFARQTAQYFGSDLIETGKAYSRMIGSVGDKAPLEDVRNMFLSINEAAVVLGLSADDTAGSLRAIQQVLGKGKFMAEEVRSQLGDRMPIFLRALEEGAKAAGLAVDEVGIDKLMEQGKLTLDILPHVSKALSDIARNNNAVEKAVSQNFAPALGRATNTLKDFANSIFKGMKPAMVSILNSFSAVGDQSKNLAITIGSFLGGAIRGLTFPVAMLVAGLTDLTTIIGDLFGISSETSKEFLTFAAGAAGMAVGLMGLFRIVKMLVNGVSLLASGFGAVSAGAASATAAVGGLTTAATGALAVFSKLFAAIAAVTAVWKARPDGEWSATSLFGDNEITRFLDKPLTEHFASASSQVSNKQQVQVNVGVDPATGNLNGYVTGQMDNYMNDMYQSTYNNLSPSM